MFSSMRRTLLLFIAFYIGGATLTGAQEPGSSVATGDGYAAVLTNPAAIGVGNADGVALSYSYPVTAAAQPATFVEGLDGLSFYTTGLGSSYAFRRRGGSNWHDLGFGMEAGRNVFIGGAAGIENLSFEQVSYRAGVLYRPVDYVSLGLVVSGTSAPQISGRIGIGVRPLAFSEKLENLLTLDGDVAYTVDQGVTVPRIGVSVAAPESVTMSAAYNVESGAFTIGAGFSYQNLKTGGGYRSAETGPGAIGDLHISPREFPTADALGRPYVAEYEPGPAIVERAPGTELPGFAELSQTTSISQVVSDIRRLTDDPRVTGILFRNHTLQISLANVYELQEALREFKDAGKKVAFFYETVGNINYAFAAGVADEIYLHPHGVVGLTGLAVARPYLAELFDRLGIGISNIRSHPPKSAYNIFSEPGPTPEERENLELLYDSLYDEFVSMIADGRGDRLEGDVRDVIDGGPYLTATSAMEAGLVDELLYSDEVDEAVAELAGGAKPQEADFPRYLRTSWADPPVHRVAIIYAVGNITTGEGQPGTTVGSDTVVRAIRNAREDRNVDAILIRIDSGGGSSLASDMIAREVARTSTGDPSKPVVVSMGATAASGGYYIAAPATHIVAQPTTVTGSIGVVALLLDIEELSDKIGVTWDAILRGENADFGAIYRQLSEQERERLRESVAYSYDAFVETVATGRDMTPEEVNEVAQGQVWTGAQALERGLVDSLGGVQEAVRVLEDILPGDRDLVFREFTGIENPLDTLLNVGLLSFRGSETGSALPPEIQGLIDLRAELATYGEERSFARAPADLAPRAE
jgi:protease IV